MEFINEITLQGIIGNIRTDSYNGVKMARIGVATNTVYTSKDGVAVIDTQWHNVVAWENPDKPDGITGLDTFQKGDKVRITGSIKYVRYTGTDGAERTSTEIKAKTLAYVKD